jgi:hypothetical protein
MIEIMGMMQVKLKGFFFALFPFPLCALCASVAVLGT